MTVYRVTDEDGENEQEIEAIDEFDAACEYAAMSHDNSGETPHGMVVAVDGHRYRIGVDWDPIYYATEMKP